MSKDSALVRQWLLLMMLSRRIGVTVQELAKELEVTEKTIRQSDLGVDGLRTHRSRFR